MIGFIPRFGLQIAAGSSLVDPQGFAVCSFRLFSTWVAVVWALHVFKKFAEAFVFALVVTRKPKDYKSTSENG